MVFSETILIHNSMLCFFMNFLNRVQIIFSSILSNTDKSDIGLYLPGKDASSFVCMGITFAIIRRSGTTPSSIDLFIIITRPFMISSLAYLITEIFKYVKDRLFVLHFVYLFNQFLTACWLQKNTMWVRIFQIIFK